MGQFRRGVDVVQTRQVDAVEIPAQNIEVTTRKRLVPVSARSLVCSTASPTSSGGRRRLKGNCMADLNSFYSR